MAVDVDKLLLPVSPERPCGEDLSYDPAFLEVEQIAAGKPEREVGNEVIPAEPPDWKQLRAKSAELLGRTKDLRVVLHLAMAALKLDGLPGLRDGLTLLRGVLERYWDQVHPQLDPADGNDPLLRMNVISALVDPALRQSIREAPLANSPQLGRFGLRDIEIATGEAPASANAPKVELSMIDGAFTGTSLEHLQAVESAAGESIELTKAIDGYLTTQVGTNRAISLRDLEALLGKARAQAQKYLAKRGVGPAPASDAANAATTTTTTGGPSATAAAGNGELRSKQDIIDTIDRICDWYARNEPSSPVPLLLKRARRLVTKNFLEIIKDLTPDSLRAIEALAGQENGES